MIEKSGRSRGPSATGMVRPVAGDTGPQSQSHEQRFASSRPATPPQQTSEDVNIHD